MKALLKLLLAFALVFTGMEMTRAAVSPVQEETPAACGAICETDSDFSGDERHFNDLGLNGPGCEYVPAGTLTQTARVRTTGGARRCVIAFNSVFVKDRGLVNAVSSVGFAPRTSAYVSGTLSADAHFVILRKFRI